MTTLPNRHDYDDLLRGEDDPALAHLVADIDQALRAPAPPPALRAALRRELDRRTAVAPRAYPPRPRAIVWPLMRRKAPSVVAAALVALGILVGYVRLAAPPPASAAQVILRKATAALRGGGPNGVAHAVYVITDPKGVNISGTAVPTATLDLWTQSDASGATLRQALAFTDGKGRPLGGRTILVGHTATTYDPASNTVMTGTLASDSGGAGVANPFDPAGLAQLAQGADRHARLLPRQTLDGVPVDVVAVDRSADNPANGTVTFYIDARTYVPRRIDFPSGTSISSMRLASYAIVPRAAVPAGTFDVPRSARVFTPSDSRRLTLAQAVSLQGVPAPLLPGAPDGLRLRRITNISSMPGSGLVDYVYQAPGKLFVVAVVQARQFTMEPPAPWQHLTLTTLGETVRATYAYGAITPGHPYHALVYRQRAAWVNITGSGLNRRAFFTLVGRLVDGKAHPDAITRVQQGPNVAPTGR